MTSSDYSKLSRLIGSYLDSSSLLPPHALRYAKFVLDRTLPWKKFVESIQPRHIYHGIDKALRISLFDSKQLVYKSRQFLLSNDYLREGKIDGKKVTGLNVLKLVWDIQIMASKYRWKNIRLECQRLYPLVQEEIELNTLQEILNETVDREKARKEREKEKQNTKTLTPAGAESFIARVCEDIHGDAVKPETFPWTGKTRGQARNFIKYCEMVGMDPKEEIRDAVRYWPDYYDQIKDKFGKPINSQKRNAFHFEFFFTYREQIHKEIEEIKQTEQTRSHVINIADYKGGR